MQNNYLFVWLLAAVVQASASETPLLTHADVYTSGTDGYHTYRIPAIETAPDGSLLAFAEARKYNMDDPGYGRQDIDLVLKRSNDHGATWSAMSILEDPGELWSAANPSTVVDRFHHTIWVFYLRSRPQRSTETSRPGTDDMQTIARSSRDNGLTWTEPLDLTSVARDVGDETWRASVPGPGGSIQTRQGRLLVPMWKTPFANFVLYSDDHGRSWQRSTMVPADVGGNENQLVELTDGRILMDIRQEAGPHRWLACSHEAGANWYEPQPGLSVTPVMCAIERFHGSSPSGDLPLIVWTGPKGPDRRRLILRASEDQGKSFAIERLISEDFAAYSDLTVLIDQSLGVLWERGVERGYQFITFTRLSKEWLRLPSRSDSSR